MITVGAGAGAELCNHIPQQHVTRRQASPHRAKTQNQVDVRSAHVATQGHTNNNPVAMSTAMMGYDAA